MHGFVHPTRHIEGSIIHTASTCCLFTHVLAGVRSIQAVLLLLLSLHVHVGVRPPKVSVGGITLLLLGCLHLLDLFGVDGAAHRLRVLEPWDALARAGESGVLVVLLSELGNTHVLHDFGVVLGDLGHSLGPGVRLTRNARLCKSHVRLLHDPLRLGLRVNFIGVVALHHSVEDSNAHLLEAVPDHRPHVIKILFSHAQPVEVLLTSGFLQCLDEVVSQSGKDFSVN